jgi:hypothetical protein
MKGLIVAGAATLAGIVGVVGLSTAMDGGAVPEAATSTARTATTEAPASLDDRLRSLDRAERAARQALARTVPLAPAAGSKLRGDGSVDDSQPGVTAGDDHWDDDRLGDDDHARDDDHGGRGDDDGADEDDHGRGRGRGGDDD